MTLELKQAIDGIASMVSKIQETNDDLSKKYDGLTNCTLKNLQGELDKKLENYEELKSEVKASKERAERLEAMFVAGNMSSDKKESNSEYKNALRSYIRNNKLIDLSLSDSFTKSVLEDAYKGTESKHLDIHLKTLRSDIGPDGGYFVMPQYGGVRTGRYFETTPMNELATVENIVSNEYIITLDDNESGAIVPVSQITESPEVNTPQVGQLKFLVNEFAAFTTVTQSQLDDTPDVENWLINKMQTRFQRDFNTYYVSGDGADKPKGFLSYAAWSNPTTIAGATGTYERGKVEQISSGIAGQLSVDGLRCLQSSLKDEYQDNAVFLMKRMTWFNAVVSKDGVGQYLINPNFMKEGTDLTLLGRPVVFANDMQAVANNALAVAYGDFKEGYLIVNRLGMRIQRNPYKTPSLIKFYAFARTGGGVKNFEAIKLLKLAA
jgi:HK97 family phage major capsid protein